MTDSDKPKQNVSINIQEFLRMTTNEKTELLKTLPDEIVTFLLDEASRLLQITMTNYEENDKLLKKIQRDIQLHGYQNYDHSNIVLVRNVKQSDESDHGEKHQVNARCYYDKIVLFIDNWSDFLKTPEYITYVLNHESIHAILDKVLYEDETEDKLGDVHFPYFAGGIDECVSLTMSETHRDFYMHPYNIKNTMKLFSYTNNYNPLDMLRRLGWKVD
mgnify:CR=1